MNETSERRGEWMTMGTLLRLHRGMTLQEALERDEQGIAQSFGIGCHVLTLEGLEAFDQRFIVGGPVNPKTGKNYGEKTKKHQAWAAEQDKPAVRTDDFKLMLRMDHRLRQIKAFKQLTDRGEPEISCECDWHGFPCRARFDFLSEYGGGALVDLKTTAEISGFFASIHAYGYLHQMAFYRALLRQQIKKTLPAFFVAIDKQDNPQGFVMRIDAEQLDQAERENIKILDSVRDKFFVNREEILKCKQQPENQLEKSSTILMNISNPTQAGSNCQINQQPSHSSQPSDPQQATA